MAKSALLPSQLKLLFTLPQLSAAYGVHATTVRKMIGNIKPAQSSNRAQVWLLGDITTLNDVRKPYIPPEPDEEVIETDPDKMKPADRRVHYQAEDLKEASELKRRKNDLESGAVIAAVDVERALAEAFKVVALLLDTLPDIIERDGILAPSDIPPIIDLLDGAREQLANDLSKLSDEVGRLNEEGDY